MLAAPSVAAGQSSRLAALRDSLAQVTDSASLRSLLGASPARTAEDHVARGLLSYRRFELTLNARDLDLARREVAVQTRDTAVLLRAAAALNRVAQAGRADAGVQTSFSRVLLALGWVDAAADAARDAV